MSSDGILIDVRDLRKHFLVRSGLGRSARPVKAVDGVSFTVRRGEALGLAGESGCGKTTVARCMLKLMEPTGGHVYWKTPKEVLTRIAALEGEAPGRELEELQGRYSLEGRSGREMMPFRRSVQMVFQDPFSSLDPRMLVKDIVGEPLAVHRVAKGAERRRRTEQLLHAVGLGSEHLYRFPHQLSGGQRQRVGIARSLALDPEMLVLDEPTSSLDVSVQAQILNLLSDLRAQKGLSYLLISHDLGVIRHMCDRVMIMYMGKIVESAPRDALFGDPLHPFTQALIGSVPVPDPTRRRPRVQLAGEIPSPADVPAGCRFHTRCRYRKEICEKKEPELSECKKKHYVACHLLCETE